MRYPPAEPATAAAGAKRRAGSASGVDGDVVNQAARRGWPPNSFTVLVQEYI